MTQAEHVQPKLTYRLITGPDDITFRERVSEALNDGYRLYAGPAATFDGDRVVLAQAVVLDIAIDNKGAQR
jgi:hypothetical protein